MKTKRCLINNKVRKSNIDKHTIRLSNININEPLILSTKQINKENELTSKEKEKKSTNKAEKFKVFKKFEKKEISVIEETEKDEEHSRPSCVGLAFHESASD